MQSVTGNTVMAQNGLLFADVQLIPSAFGAWQH